MVMFWYKINSIGPFLPSCCKAERVNAKALQSNLEILTLALTKLPWANYTACLNFSFFVLTPSTFRIMGKMNWEPVAQHLGSICLVGIGKCFPSKNTQLGSAALRRWVFQCSVVKANQNRHKRPKTLIVSLWNLYAAIHNQRNSKLALNYTSVMHMHWEKESR